MILNSMIPFRFRYSRGCCAECRRPCISCPHTIQIQWRREMKGHQHSAQHTCAAACGSILSLYDWFFIDTQGPMKRTVLTLVQFLPKYHRISMQERFARAYALCTTYGYSARTIEFHRYSPWVSLTDQGFHLVRSISIYFLWGNTGNFNGNFSSREEMLARNQTSDTIP
jgi:hypothetical protein